MIEKTIESVIESAPGLAILSWFAWRLVLSHEKVVDECIQCFEELRKSRKREK